MNKFFSFALIVLILSISTNSTIAKESAKEKNVNPGINDYYYDADFSDWLSTFESQGREVYDFKDKIVESLNLKSGWTVADIGAGTGLFSIPFAKAVGDKGTVYAVDISKSFVENILKRAKQEGLSNVEGIINNQNSTLLPKNSTHLAFISDTYHHFEYPKATLASIHKALKEKGQLVIIDYRKVKGKSSSWVMEHVRLNKQLTIDEVEQSGFKLIKDFDVLDRNYFLVFEKN